MLVLTIHVYSINICNILKSFRVSAFEVCMLTLLTIHRQNVTLHARCMVYPFFVCVHIYLHLQMCVYVCVCVCERERERAFLVAYVEKVCIDRSAILYHCFRVYVICFC